MIQIDDKTHFIDLTIAFIDTEVKEEEEIILKGVPNVRINFKKKA